MLTALLHQARSCGAQRDRALRATQYAGLLAREVLAHNELARRSATLASAPHEPITQTQTLLLALHDSPLAGVVQVVQTALCFASPTDTTLCARCRINHTTDKHTPTRAGDKTCGGRIVRNVLAESGRAWASALVAILVIRPDHDQDSALVMTQCRCVSGIDTTRRETYHLSERPACSESAWRALQRVRMHRHTMRPFAHSVRSQQCHRSPVLMLPGKGRLRTRLDGNAPMYEDVRDQPTLTPVRAPLLRRTRRPA